MKNRISFLIIFFFGVFINATGQSKVIGSVIKSKFSTATTQPILRLQISNGSNIDEAIIYSNPNASNGYDQYDSPKMFNASTSLPEIYTEAGSDQVAINGLNSIPYDTEYPLGLLILNTSIINYSIKASQFSNFPTGAKILLKDKLNINSPVTTDLTNGVSYTFSSGVLNYNTSRFAIIFKSPDPTITTSGTLSAVHTIYGTASPVPATFKVSGSFLTSNIVITAPSGFEISKTSGGASGYYSSLTLIPTVGTVAETTIYLRISSATVSGNYSGNISCVSSGATTLNIATVSSTVSPKSLSISGLTVFNKAYDGNNSASFTGTAVFSGLVNNENFVVTGSPIATFNNESVGTAKTITINGFNNPSANYTVISPTFTADITAIATTITESGSIGTSDLLQGTDLTVISGVELDIDQNSKVHSILVNPGGKLSLNSAKTLTVGTLTLQSNTDETATFVDADGTLNSNKTYVQQYLSSGRNWYISTPVIDATSAVFAPTDQNLMYWYDEVQGTNAPWIHINDSYTALKVMKGYVAKVVSDGVVTFTGTLNTGTKSISVTRTAGQIKEGFNLIGNPYPSFLDWDKLDKTNLLSTMWYRTKTIANTYTFDTYNSTAHLGTSNGTTKVTNLIPPMQAFWVRVLEGQTQADIYVNNSCRTHADFQNNSFKAKDENNLNKQILHLQVSNGTNTDETIIYSNSNASNGFDAYDSPKMFNSTAEVAEIYTVSSKEPLAINGFNTLPHDADILVGFTTSISGNFSLKAIQITNFEPGTQIILKDYLDVNNPVITDLSEGNSYLFSSDVTSDINRFKLLLHAPSVTTQFNPSQKSTMWISTNSSAKLLINGEFNGETSLMVYNAVGQCVTTQNITSTHTAINTILTPGVYTVIIKNILGRLIQKVIVK